MNANFIRTLAETPPPHSARALASRIAALESELGLPASNHGFRVKDQRVRLAELEAMKTRFVAVPSQPPTSAPVSSAQSCPAALTDAQLFKLSDAVFPGNGLWQHEDHSVRRSATAEMFFARHLSYPACDADFAQLPPNLKRQELAAYDGASRSARAFTQAKIDSEVKRIRGAAK